MQDKSAAWKVFGIGWLIGMVIMVVIPAMDGKPIQWLNIGWWIDNSVSAALLGVLGCGGWLALSRR